MDGSGGQVAIISNIIISTRNISLDRLAIHKKYKNFIGRNTEFQTRSQGDGVFDQDIQETFILSDAADSDAPTMDGGNDACDITEAVIACTGARDACLLRLLPNARGRREFIPPRSRSAAFFRLDQSLKSMQGGIDRLLRSDMSDCKPFWLRGIDNVLCVPLAIDGQLAACMVLSYPAHGLNTGDTDAEKRAQMIAPLVKTYLQTTEKLTAVARRFDGAMGFLDVSHVSLILFDNQGRMLLANTAAQAMLDAQDGMRIGNWAPVPLSLKDAARFQLALEHQIAENAAGRSAKRRSTVLLIQRRKGLRPFVATLIPMPTPAANPGDPAVMLYLFDPSDEQFDHLDAISELYGLSRVEARLAHHIALGKTIEEAAAAMRIKVPTARTYLKHIFTKTGTHRQIDLVRLLMLSTGRITSQEVPEALR